MMTLGTGGLSDVSSGSDGVLRNSDGSNGISNIDGSCFDDHTKG